MANNKGNQNSVTCPECGRSAIPEANFCMQCGSQLREPSQQMEKCEISFEFEDKDVDRFEFNKGRFVAKATGPNGTRTVAKSEMFEYNPLVCRNSLAEKGEVHEDESSALECLVNELLEDGWIHTGTGKSWFQHRFHRPCV